MKKEISALKKELMWHKVAISALIRQVVSPEDKVNFMKHFSCSSNEFLLTVLIQRLVFGSVNYFRKISVNSVVNVRIALEFKSDALNIL
ncbi:hypothetical protein ACSHJO_004385 [Escherichia coli]